MTKNRNRKNKFGPGTSAAGDDTENENFEFTFHEDATEEETDVDVIDVANNLHDKVNACGHTLNIPLPQIVVIGGQSSGKSSTLESFVGKEFLPRGTGLVTRRPTIVQLIPCPEEYGVFLHRPDQKYTDFSEIRSEIVRATEEECGATGFSSNPITLKIYSPNVLKLTVVDLPGIIQVTVDDQVEEDIQEVRSMILQFINDKNSIILCVVSAAGEDLSSSTALALAKQADPKYERTIGVLTKIDLMDEGVNARTILENGKVKLKIGWVAVLNRNQREITEGKDMRYILQKEKDFFRNNEHYSDMAHRLGSPYLQRLLQKILRIHIKQCLPTLRIELAQKLMKYRKELKDFAHITDNGPNARENYMIMLIQKVSSDITMKIMGYSEQMPMDRITYGAHINYKLYTEVPKFISQDLIPNEKDLSILIANINGIRNSISVPSALAMDSMCRKLIEGFKYPIDESVECVSQVLFSAILESAALIDRYPSLRNELVYQVQNWIEEETGNTQERLKAHIDAEMFYINIGHPDFNAAECDSVAPPAGPVKMWGKKVDEPSSVNEEISVLSNELTANGSIQKQVSYVSAMVLNYMKIVHKTVLDLTIKYIATFLVKKVLDHINNDLVTTMVNFPNKASIMEDYENDYKQKEELERSCATLSDALHAIANF